MSKVYFIENTESDYGKLGKDAVTLLKRIVAETGHKFEKEVPIKVHFGEKGNKTFIPPRCYDETIEYLKENGVTPFILNQMSSTGVKNNHPEAYRDGKVTWFYANSNSNSRWRHWNRV